MLARFVRSLVFGAGLVVTQNTLAIQTEVPPSLVKMVFGRILDGDEFSLFAVDGRVLHMSRFTVPNVPVDPVRFNVEANVPRGTATLSFKIIGRSLSMGVYTESLNWYDWRAKNFDPYTNVTAPFPKTSFELSDQAMGDVGRFVRDSDSRVRVLVRVRPIGPTPLLLWEVEYERAWFVCGS